MAQILFERNGSTASVSVELTRDGMVRLIAATERRPENKIDQEELLPPDKAIQLGDELRRLGQLGEELQRLGPPGPRPGASK